MIKQVSRLLFFLLIVILALQPLVVGNPLPVYTDLGSPLTLWDNGIQFFSEYVEYEINDEDDVKVTANYTFYNPTNETINGMVSLPFTRHRLPDNLIIEYNGTEIEYYQEEHSSGFLMDLGIDVYSHFDFAVFDLSFDSYNFTTINVSYSPRMTISDKSIILITTYSTEYITKTGSLWNGTIQNAHFKFKINKEIFTYENSESFDISEEGEYIVLSKSFTDWTPNININLKWTNINYFAVLIVLLCIFIPCFLVIVIFRIYNKKNKNHYKK